jgi:hypothetical protein
VHEHPWWAAWIAATLFFGVFLATLDPIFDVPDDAFIMFVLDGFFYGEPGHHTTFVSTLLTRGLAQLYAWAPSVPWYGVFLYGLHFAAIVVWLYLFLRRPRAPLEIVLFLFAGLSLSLPVLLQVTFTSSALSVGAMGVFLHFERQGGAGSTAAAAWAGVLLGLAYLTRESAFPAVLLALVPMLLFRARAIPVRSHALALAVFLALVLMGQWSDSLAYGSPEWQSFRHRGPLDFALIDSPRLAGPDALAAAAKVGWSENDLALYRRFIFADPEVYGIDTIDAITEETAGLRWVRNPFQAAWDRLLGEHSIELLIILLYLVVFVPRMSGRDRWTALALGASFAAGALYLATFRKFPSRVALPTTWMVVAWIAVAPHARRDLLLWVRRPGTRRVVTRTLAALLLAVPLVEVVLESRENAEKRDGFLESLFEQQEYAPGSLVIALSELPFDALSPLTTRHDLPEFDYIGLGWRVHSPTHTAHLARLGVENVYLAPIERPDVFLAIHEDLYPLYAEFVQEHHQRVPTLEPLLPIDGRMHFYGHAP